MCETSLRRIFIPLFQQLKEFRGHLAIWNYQLREKVKQCGMHGFGLFKRGYDIVQMGAKRLEKFWQHGILDLFDQAEKERQL
jgi:hypothetical protein